MKKEEKKKTKYPMSLLHKDVLTQIEQEDILYVKKKVKKLIRRINKKKLKLSSLESRLKYILEKDVEYLIEHRVI